MHDDDTTVQEQRPSRRRLLAVIAMGLLALAACGGDASPRFPDDAYPPALRPTPGADISSMTGGCPDLDFVTDDDLTVDQAVDVLNDFLIADPDDRRELSDTAFWLLLSGPPVAAEPLSQEQVEVGPAAEGPHAALLTNACGELTVRASRWVQLCPGACQAAGSESLISHWYLIERRGRWLVWASE